MNFDKVLPKSRGANSSKVTMKLVSGFVRVDIISNSFAKSKASVARHPVGVRGVQVGERLEGTNPGLIPACNLVGPCGFTVRGPAYCD